MGFVLYIINVESMCDASNITLKYRQNNLDEYIIKKKYRKPVSMLWHSVLLKHHIFLIFHCLFIYKNCCVVLVMPVGWFLLSLHVKK